MASTLKFTVNNTGNDESIVVQTCCHSIIFGEDESVASFPTVDWQWKAPGSADYATLTRGSKREFHPSPRNFFHPGDIVAFVKTVSGSSSFIQEEL